MIHLLLLSPTWLRKEKTHRCILGAWIFRGSWAHLEYPNFQEPKLYDFENSPVGWRSAMYYLVLWTSECICMDNFRYFLIFLFTETELYASLRSMLAIQHPGWIMAITCGLYLQKTTSYHHIWGCYCLHLRPLDLFWVLLCVLANESSRPLGSSPKSSWLYGKEVCQRPPYSLGQFLVSLDLPSSTILVFV